MRFYWPIQKLDHEQHMVWGYASTEAEDEQGEVIRRDALAAALEDYMRFANIREMHQPSAVGIAEEAAIDDKGLYLGARIVDGDAWRKVVAGVYKGFSIGGHVTARDPADRNIVTGLALSEISVVDRPANPEAVFDCWKRAAADTSAADMLERLDELPEALIAPCPDLFRAPTSSIGRDTKDVGGRDEPGHGERGGDRVGASPRNAGAPGRLRALLAELCELLDSFSSENTDAIAALALSGSLRKSRPAETDVADRLAKFADDILPRLDALQRRVEDIAQTPLPPLTVTTASRGFSAIDKRADGAAVFIATDDIVAALARMNDEERTLALIKAARAAPLMRR
jgi:phage head maturation protease